MISGRKKKKIAHISINFIMYLLVVVTIFPIFWMIVTSLKNNNDILLGKIWFGRKSNAVRSIFHKGSDVWFITNNSIVGRYDLESNKFKNQAVGKLKAANFIGDKNFLWVSSEKGLMKVRKDVIKLPKAVLPFKVSWMAQNSVDSTTLLLTDDKVWMGKIMTKSELDEEEDEYAGKFSYEGILRFDRETGKYIDTINDSDGLADNNVHVLARDGNFIWIGTKKGLSKYNLNTKKFEGTYYTSDGLICSDIQAILVEANHLWLGTPKGIMKFDKAKGACVFSCGEDEGLIQKDVRSFILEGDLIWLGTGQGIVKFDRVENKVIDSFPKEDSESWEITSLAMVDGVFWAGFDDGLLKKMNKENFSIIDTYEARRGILNIRWTNYVDMWKNISFGTYLKNSFVICGLTMIISMVLASLAAYSLSRFNFPGSTFFGTSILTTQMIPGLMFLIPIYLMFVKFTEATGIKMIGTYHGIIFTYSAFFVPFSIWILRSFFASIPVQIEEAARIDGCSRIGIFFRIVLPLALPGIIATGIFIFLTAWDELMFGTVLLPQRNTLTVPLGIRLYIGNHQNRFDLMMAAATVATIPVLALFFIMQKWIVQGLTAGAVKE